MLGQLGVIGVSWREDGSEALADYAIADDKLSAALSTFAQHNGISELAYLSTCNRVEILFLRSEHDDKRDLRPQVFAMLRDHAPEPGEAEQVLRAWGGEGAAEHLFLVTAALDSACIGEVEIAGQVRRAHDRARELGHCGPALDLLFNEAYRILGRVRGETQVSSGRVSLAEIAVDEIKARHARTAGTVALVGVSAMTIRAAVSLKSANIPFLVVNRSLDNARTLAAQYDVPYLSLDHFRDTPPSTESVLSCTGASNTVLDEAALVRIMAATKSGDTPLMIDMSVPPDIDPQACDRLKVQRIGMDEIIDIASRNRSGRDSQAAAAREIVDEALVELNARFADRLLGPMFAVLQNHYQQTANASVERLFKQDLGSLDETQRAAVHKWCESLARRFAHIPNAGLRGLMHHGPEGSVDAFLDALDPKFASQLRGASAPESR
ncbi:MAG: glutamyl-tRNA reductase [Gammaproteobacteria bacterium]|jgi:glutamyl-tRNA reductase